jgi:quinol-cytochrome oxidoreductase complex cytochrome b subunit
VVGVILLVLTLLLSYTGYLLPWDQLAFWAVTVGTNLAGATPFFGHEGPFASLLGAKINNDIRFLLLGGTKVGQNALLRFYVLHCILLPLEVMEAEGSNKVEKVKKVNVWPHLVFRELVAVLFITFVFYAISLFIDAPLEGVADPTHTPSPAKAPWYFVGIQELLVYFDPWMAGVVIPAVIIFGLMEKTAVSMLSSKGDFPFHCLPLALPCGSP